jgi:hypothetical protein
MLMGTAALTNVRGQADESEILGIEVLTKTANGEADLFHQIGNCDIFKSFLGETFGGGTHEALMSFDFIVLEWPITKN